MTTRLRNITTAAMLSAALLFAFWPAITAMVGLWTRSPMYSYAFTVPFISLYLLWYRRAALAELVPQPSWWLAAPVLLAGVATLLAGRLSTVMVLEQIALLVCLVGVVLAVLGRAYVQASWAAIAYLLLMIPVWDGLTEPLHPMFQEQSAIIGSKMLSLVGVPVHRAGIIMSLPRLDIEVARSCSGVNYLIAVLALGLPLAYVSLPGVWRRVSLIIMALVIAALSNGLRVALIGLLANYEVGSPLHGPMHVLHGLFVAFIGYAALFLGVRLLSPASASTPAAPAAPVRREWKRLSPVPVVALTLLFALIGLVPQERGNQAVVLAGGLDALPSDLGPWTAQRFTRPADVSWWSTADVQLRRRYAHTDGRVVDVYVAYFQSQHQDKELASYRNADLHRLASPADVSLPDGATLPVNVAQEPRGRTVLFWYEIDGRVATRPYETKLRTLWTRVRHGRSNAAVVMLASTPGAAPADGAAGEDLRELAALVYRGLDGLLPTGITRQHLRVAAAVKTSERP